MKQYEFKGTQGRWMLENGFVKAGSLLTPIATATSMLPASENLANLTLIAASKDLLEACIAVSEAREKALTTEDLFAVLEAIRHKVNPAISKALNTTSNE